MTLGRMHLVLIDEADGMTNPAQLALLSKLDATPFPPNTIFVFTCNGTDGLEPRFILALRRFSKISHPRSPELIHPLEN
jgi:DNA polymerase III delta prime subunit